MDDMGDSDPNSPEAAVLELSGAAVEEMEGLPQPAIIEVSASLGELALFVSGRICEDWWPPVVRLCYACI